MKDARWLIRHLRPYFLSALGAFVLATAAGLVSTVDPLLMRHLIDKSSYSPRDYLLRSPEPDPVQR